MVPMEDVVRPPSPPRGTARPGSSLALPDSPRAFTAAAISRSSSPDPPPSDASSEPRRDRPLHARGPVEAASLVPAPATSCTGDRQPSLDRLPNEILLHILGFLDVSDLLATSRTSRHLRDLSLAPILHSLRLRHIRHILPPLLSSPSRPTLAELISRSIFLTHTSVVSRRLARSLVSIRLARRLAARPSAEALVDRAVLPRECVPGAGSLHVAPGLVAKRQAVEKERVKDALRRWIGAVWKGEVTERAEGVRRWEERVGAGRVWRLRRFWESIGRGQ